MRRYKRFITSLVVVLTLIVAAVPAMDVQAETVKMYTVTLRAGNVGSFDTSKIAKVGQSTEVSANYIKFQVERGSSLVKMGYFSDANALDGQLLNAIQIDGTYFLKSASEIANQTITSNTEYVLDYGKLVDPVEYSIYFLDTESGEQIAAPTLAYGNAGDVIEVTPLAVDGYETTDESIQITLSREEENTVSFSYTFVDRETQTNVVQVEVPGDNVTNTIVNEVPVEVPTEEPVVIDDEDVPLADNPEDETPGDAENEGEQTIEDNDVPLADNPEDGTPEDGENAGETPGDAENEGEQIIEDDDVPLADNPEDETVIEDEDVPLAANESESGNFTKFMIGVGVVVVLAGATVLITYKKKKGRIGSK